MSDLFSEAVKSFDLSDNFIDIDVNRLDEECLRQPRLMFEVALQYHQAQRTLADAKAELDVYCADLAQRIRRQPDTFGIEKVTEATIKEAVDASEKVANRIKNINELKNRADIAKAAVDALDHRKRMLELLVTLHGQSYFASPRTTAEAREAIPKKPVPSLKRPKS